MTIGFGSKSVFAVLSKHKLHMQMQSRGVTLLFAYLLYVRKQDLSLCMPEAN
jgi:hypothetical protein